MTRSLLLSITLCGSLLSPLAAADSLEPSLGKKGEQVLEESFDGDAFVHGWTVQKGDWKPVGEVMVGKEIPADKHAAAARRLMPMQDGIYQLRFRLTGAAKSFHFGFDPARGELEKRGHLFSIIVTPAQAQLLKHIDKDRPKEAPNEELAVAKAAFKLGVWHTLLVEKKGNNVTAKIVSESGDVSISLAATHPTFHVKTPTMVFRCQGDGVEVDDLRVWTIAEAE